MEETTIQVLYNGTLLNLLIRNDGQMEHFELTKQIGSLKIEICRGWIRSRLNGIHIMVRGVLKYHSEYIPKKNIVSQ